jgi:hypothetical protein
MISTAIAVHDQGSPAIWPWCRVTPGRDSNRDRLAGSADRLAAISPTQLARPNPGSGMSSKSWPSINSDTPDAAYVLDLDLTLTALAFAFLSLPAEYHRI